MSRLPPLNTLHVFNVAARTVSFVKAADELHVTHGAVSRQIRLLEETLGCALFERRNRAVFLTPQGKLLQATTAQVFEQLEKGLADLRQPQPDAPLTVSCEPTILMKWLIPRLGDFYRCHPGVQLHLYAGGGEVGFQRNRVDIALRRNDFYWDASVHSEKMCDEWMAPVCAPSLLRRGKLKLACQRLLHTDSRPQAWANWSATTGHDIGVCAGQQYEHFYLTVQAAGAGLGIALGSAYMVQEEVGSGRLVTPFGFARDGSAYMLLSPTPIQDDPRRAAFRDWVRAEMERTLLALSVAA